jgi:hypothetical protein
MQSPDLPPLANVVLRLAAFRHWSGQMLEEPAVRELDELVSTYEADRSA